MALVLVTAIAIKDCHYNAYQVFVLATTCNTGAALNVSIRRHTAMHVPTTINAIRVYHWFVAQVLFVNVTLLNGGKFFKCSNARSMR